jgi:hypothetical protein
MPKVQVFKQALVLTGGKAAHVWCIKVGEIFAALIAFQAFHITFIAFIKILGRNPKNQAASISAF